MRWDPSAASPLVDDARPTDEEAASGHEDLVGSGTVDPSAEQTAPAQGSSAEPAFRQRDFRPESNRSSFAPAFVVGAPQDPSESGAATPDAAGAGRTDTSGDDIDLAAPERTMTRRELRILRARAEAAGLPAPDIMFLPNGESTVTGAIPVLDGVAFSAARGVAPEADAAGVISEEPVDTEGAPGVQEPADASAEADSDVTESDIAPAAVEPDSGHDVTAPGSAADEPMIDGPAASDIRQAGEDPSLADGVDEPEIIPALVEPESPASARYAALSVSMAADVPAEIVVDAEPATGDHPVSASAESSGAGGVVTESDDAPAPGSLRPFDAMFLPPSTRVDDHEPADSLVDTASAHPANDTDGLRADILAAPAGAARPFGHWSTQDDDDDTSSDPTLSRNVGTGVLTTHALVLPSIPDAGEPLMSPLTSTGEVMVTGMVELPKSFGSTGAHPMLFDHPEVDSLIEDTDREDTDSGAAPVRATRAVSSTTTTRSMVETTPTRRSRVLPILLIIVGGVVLVAAASWAIAAFVFDTF